MAPFRASRSTRSGRPGGPSDHDIFDGLPVRQWKMHESPFGVGEDIQGDAAKSAAAQNGGRAELPMPKGSDQYPAWSLQLLRAARSGKVLKSQVGASGHDPDNENGVEESHVDEVQRGTKRGPQNGFVATKWSQVPKHLEGPEREYVAKRRKGLQSTFYATNGISSASADGAHMRKTKVQRSDEEGLPQVLEVMVPEGKTVEGEIKNESAPEVIAAPIANPAPGTVVEGLGVANEDGVVIATEGIVPLKKRHGPVGRKKKNRGTKKISSTEGMGVSASAEAFQEQLRAQRLAESGASGDADGQKDNTMSGVGEGDEDDDDEEGSGEDEEEADDEENPLHEGDQDLQTPAANGDTSMILDETSGPPSSVLENNALKQSPEDEQQTLPQDHAPMDIAEEPPEQLLDGPYELIEHEAQNHVHKEPQEEAMLETADAQEAEPPVAVKDEVLEEIPLREEVADDIPTKPEPPQEDATVETIEDAKPEPQDHAPTPSGPEQQIQTAPPEEPHTPEQDAPVEAPNSPKVEPIEGPPAQQNLEEPNDDSSDVPTRPSPEPLSPYSLSPVSKAHRSPSPHRPPPRSEPSATASITAVGVMAPSVDASAGAPEDGISALAEAAERKRSGASATSQSVLSNEAEAADGEHEPAGVSSEAAEAGTAGAGGTDENPPPPQTQANGGEVNGSAE